MLQLKNTDELGEYIVVQGGTMRNDSIVRALEKLTGKQISRSDCPELMGALGCALYARQIKNTSNIDLGNMLQRAEYTSKQNQCRGCENQCTVTQYKFSNENYYYSGNRCEKTFSNKGNQSNQGINAYSHKTK